MESHNAKRSVLTKLSNQLRRTINGDMENLRFELYAIGLISLETRDGKDAGSMVSEIENRLQADGSIWDALITVLRTCGKETLASRFEEKLRQEEAERRGHVSAGGIRAGKSVKWRDTIHTC